MAESSDGGVITITWRKSASELAVTWDGPKHGTVSRVIAARPRVVDVIADAAMLAGNLARDEASDLTPDAPPPPPLPEPEPAFVIESATPVVTPPAPEKPKEDFMEANGGLIYPLAANFGRPGVRTRFDINVFSSRIGELSGFEIGGLNLVLAGDEHGTGNVSGWQIGYAANVASGELRGAQTSILVNVAGSGRGAQVAGLNVSGDFRGLQLGFLDIGRDIEGAQIGLFNIARKQKGLMLGLVNISEDAEGLPIGLVSVSKTGGIHPEAWSSLTTFANAGIKLATKHTYTMPSFGYTHAYDRDFYGAGFTVGGRFFIDDDKHVDTDLGAAFLYAPERSFRVEDPNDTYHENLVQTKLRALFGWTFAEHFGAYAGVGVTLQARIEQDGNRTTFRVGPDFFLGIEL